MSVLTHKQASLRTLSARYYVPFGLPALTPQAITASSQGDDDAPKASTFEDAT
jgi:hypothetical protein